MTEVSEAMHEMLVRIYSDDKGKGRDFDSGKFESGSKNRRPEEPGIDALEPMDFLDPIDVVEPAPPVKKAPEPAPFDFLEPVADVPAPKAVPVQKVEPAPVTPAPVIPPVAEKPPPPPPAVVPPPAPPKPEVPKVEIIAAPPEPQPVIESKEAVDDIPEPKPELIETVQLDETDSDDDEEEGEDEEVIRAQREQLEGTRVLGKIMIPVRANPLDANKKKKRKKKLSAAGEGAQTENRSPAPASTGDAPAAGQRPAVERTQPKGPGSGPFPQRAPGSGPFPQRTGTAARQGSTGPFQPRVLGQPGSRPGQPGAASTAGGPQNRRPGQPGTTPQAGAPASGAASDRNKKKKERDRHSSEEEGAAKSKTVLLQSGADAVRKRSKIRKRRREEAAQEAELQDLMDAENQNLLQVAEFITVSDLAEEIGINAAQLIGAAMKMGMFVSINQRLDAAAIELLAAEFSKEVSFIEVDDAMEDEEDDQDDPEDLKPRPPVVTVMGHVDHGKTSLLDYIKKSKIAAGEAGGITQHIGAYSVKLQDDRLITFLDTPGHEAFTAMRARGAKATDIVILVVAADDAVMPQTIEAINHAQAAGVPIVVAVNKIDKSDANPEKIKKQLSEHNVLVEEWGGKTQCTYVSAKTGQGIDDLLASVLIEAELMELKANPDRLASGVVLEARIDKGKGTVATILVQNGTLKVGDPFVAGQFSGRIRALENEFGERITEAGPATPAVITGFDGTPQAGDKVTVYEDEKTARNIAMQRQQIKREQDMRRVKHITLDDLSRRMALGGVSQLNIIIKGDVDGSIEALSGSLQKLSTDEVQIKIIHTGVGAISESDVLLASASDAIIIGFQVRPSSNARKLAESEEIDIRLFSIIYDALDAVKDAMEGMLSPEKSEKVISTVQIRETFKVPNIGTIAGCYVQEGKILRSSKIRLIRDGIVIFTGEISSLKRYKEDVREVAAGFECGMGIHNYNDLKVGDLVEAFEIVETKRKLASATAGT